MTTAEVIQNGRRRLRDTVRRTSRPARKIWPRLPEAAIGTAAVFVVLFAVLTQIPAVCRSASGLTFGNRYLSLAEGLLNPFRNRNALLESDLRVYDLKIKRQPYALVEKAVEKARKQGWMSEEMQVWVPARLFAEGREYNVKVRVRGDLPPHWSGPKKSWRIKFGKEKIQDGDEVREEPIFFEGKRQINLVVPNDRDFVVAPFVNSLMREHGLVVPRDRFVVLRINGRLQGLYYEVEHFDKPLLAAHGRPETTIFGQNDRAMHFEQYTRLGTPITSDARYDIGTMSRGVDEDGQLAMRAMQVLIDHCLHPSAQSFRRVRAVLDWEKYLRFRNITTLFNTNHVRFGSDNLRLYYDPSRGRLEPVPWDVHIVRMPKEPGTIDFWNSHGPDEIQRSTLLDPEARLERNRILWEMVDDGGQQLIAKYRALHERIRPLAWADVLTTPLQAYKMDRLKSDFEYNVLRTYKVLSHSSANVTFRLEADDRASLEAAALNFSGVHLREIQISAPDQYQGEYRLYLDANNNGVLDDDDSLLDESTALAGSIRFDVDHNVLPELHYRGETINGRYWEFFEPLSGRARFFVVGRLADSDRPPIEWTAPRVTVVAENAVTDASMQPVVMGEESCPSNTVGITSYDASDVFDLDAVERSLPEFLERYPQFATSPDQAGVELRGTVSIAETVIVPRSIPLVVQPGTDLTLASGASIVCYGGLRAVGMENQRIRVQADATGRPWGTFAAIRPPGEVVLEHVDMSGGGQAEINGILFTGGFAVHDGDLKLRDCRFAAMHSEDAVNLKNGRFQMIDTIIEGNASDGVDVDFGTGEVRRCRFVNNVNDGLDISGSRLAVIDNRFENNGDKGFSVGEDSHPVVVNALFLANNIGMASKDLSLARIAHATFVRNKLALEAKRKKPMFGGGSIAAVNCVFAANDVLLDEDYFSRGQVDVQGTLADDTADIPAAVSGSPHFRDPQTLDFRLAIDPDDARPVPLQHPDWLAGYLNGETPEVPGTYSMPSNGGALER